MAQGTLPPKPLARMRVLDLSQILAGPYCGMLLAGLGAEVIKVEAPEGDLSRSMGPPYVEGTGTLFLSVNRNKKGLVLDLKRPEGQQVLHRLVRTCDVLIHNFRPRAARQLSVDRGTLLSLNSHLVYACIAAFGQSGPHAERPGLDAVFQAMGGLMSLTGPARGGASRVAASVVDVATGIFTALGIVASLLQRERTGQVHDVGGALLDTVLALQASLFTYSSVIGQDPKRVGNGSYFTITNCFATADGQVVISLPTSRFWPRLCRALGKTGLEKDTRFAHHESRILHKTALDKALQRIFRRKTTAHWLEALTAQEVPVGPVLSYQEVFEDPQVQHNGLFKRDRYKKKGLYRVVRSPVRLSGRLMDGDCPAPRLGEHTEEILRAAKFTTREIRELRRQGIIAPRTANLD